MCENATDTTILDPARPLNNEELAELQKKHSADVLSPESLREWQERCSDHDHGD